MHNHVQVDNLKYSMVVDGLAASTFPGDMIQRDPWTGLTRRNLGYHTTTTPRLVRPFGQLGEQYSGNLWVKTVKTYHHEFCTNED